MTVSTHSAICMTMAGQIKFPLERYGNNAVSLSGAMSDICQRAGMAPTDLVLSGVTQSLRGYAVTRRMAARKPLSRFWVHILSTRWKRTVS